MRSADLVNQVRAKGKCAKGTARIGFAKTLFDEQALDALSDVEMVAIGGPVHQKRPIDIASSCEFAPSQRAKHDQTCVGR